MANPLSFNDRITRSRRLLGNPYAYLDDSDGYSAILPHEVLVKTSYKGTSLENPYANIDEPSDFNSDAVSNYAFIQIENFSKVPQEIIRKSLAEPRTKNFYSHDEIEEKARNLQISMWQDRAKIWPDGIPSNLVDILDPCIALKLIGYDCVLNETLGQFYIDGKLSEVAGTIDKSLKQVHISGQFLPNIRSFTAAHELGHALLHEIGTGLHRDRPLDGATVSRHPIESEADKFAAFFLMPRNLVMRKFQQLFLTEKFFLNEDTAFALGIGKFNVAINRYNTLHQLSRLLASVERYNGHHFISLANQFRVSIEAMAIRLEELELLVI